MAKSNTPKIATKKHLARVERERKQINLVLTISGIAIALAILLIGYGILQTTYLKYQMPVAVVNGEKISLKYWQERLQFERLSLVQTLQQYQYYQQFGMDMSQQIQQIEAQLQPGDTTLGDQMLTNLINEALIRQEAKKRGITVTDAEVNERIQQGFNFYPSGTPSPTITPTNITYPTLTTAQMTMHPPSPTPTEAPTSTAAPTNTPEPATATATVTALPSPTSLPKLPTATPTPYTLEGYKKQYADTIKNFNTTYSISEETLRSVYLNQIYREKLLAVITKDIPHTQEQVLARHILVNDAATAATVETLLKQGQDFAALAEKYSKDTGSAANGGELDWSTRDSFVKEFADAAFTQPIGEIGQPVKSQYGYHIIQVIARENLPISDTKYQQLQQTAFTDWLTKQNDDATKAKQITTYADTWKNNIPAIPATIQQLLQQAAPQ